MLDTRRVVTILREDDTEEQVTLDPKADIPGQGYRLQITPARIQLLASDAAGVFYGLATLRQMLRLRTTSAWK